MQNKTWGTKSLASVINTAQRKRKELVQVSQTVENNRVFGLKFQAKKGFTCNKLQQNVFLHNTLLQGPENNIPQVPSNPRLGNMSYLHNLIWPPNINISSIF